MRKKMPGQLAWILLLAIKPLAACSDAGSNTPTRWSWQEANAEIDPKGDLRWKPHPFVLKTGTAIRYIDFEGGDDANSGETQSAPWKHHPWDPKATAKSAAGSGCTRTSSSGASFIAASSSSRMQADRATPIRLTSDPAWGEGEAVLCGSERVTGWTKGASHKDIPEPEKVWWADLISRRAAFGAWARRATITPHPARPGRPTGKSPIPTT